MADDKRLLSDAELEYLQSVFETEEEGGEDFTQGQLTLHFENEAPSGFLQFLSQLGALNLSGSNGRCSLQFGCHVSGDTEDGPASMTLSYPRIVEEYRHSARSLRVPPAPDQILTLIDPTGTLHSPEILNLSLSGLSVCDHPPTDLERGTIIHGMILQLPNGPALKINAQVVRSQNNEGLISLGLQLLDPDATVLQQLGAYVFKRYQETEMVP